MPSSATAPMASSGLPGAPILWVRQISSGACSARATSRATITPPRGIASTTSGSGLIAQIAQRDGQLLSGFSTIEEHQRIQTRDTEQ